MAAGGNCTSFHLNRKILQARPSGGLIPESAKSAPFPAPAGKFPAASSRELADKRTGTAELTLENAEMAASRYYGANATSAHGARGRDGYALGAKGVAEQPHRQLRRPGRCNAIITAEQPRQVGGMGREWDDETAEFNSSIATDSAGDKNTQCQGVKIKIFLAKSSQLSPFIT